MKDASDFDSMKKKVSWYSWLKHLTNVSEMRENVKLADMDWM